MTNTAISSLPLGLPLIMNKNKDVAMGGFILSKNPFECCLSSKAGCCPYYTYYLMDVHCLHYYSLVSNFFLIQKDSALAKASPLCQPPILASWYQVLYFTNKI